MRSAEAEGSPLIHWSGEAYRLIPSRFPPVGVYDGLVANDRLDDVYAAEEITNPRLRSLARLSATNATTGGARLQNWNLAPFAYGDPDGSLFFGEEKPCLELAADRQTALSVSIARREAFLSATDESSTGLDMRMLCQRVEGTFWDLRGRVSEARRGDRALRLAGAAMPEGADGILYRSAYRPTGTCLAVTSGEVLGRASQSAHFRYVWDGRRVSLLYSFDEAGTPIVPGTLAGPDYVLAA